MKKLLIITYYWPPGGGAGVQRWLKFAKYLPQFGWQPVVYTPLNGEMPVIDESLLKDVPPEAVVLRTKIWEPYELYKKFVGAKGERINTGFLTERKKPGLAEKVSVWLRGNFFIPDARKFWIRPSVKYLTGYLRENPVDAIVSTGPPHSMHLIALPLAKTFNLPWVADFRDPWTNIDFYKDLMLTPLADRYHHRLERAVVTGATRVVAVGNGLKRELEEKYGRKVDVITNGYDSDDIPSGNIHANQQPRKFILAHVGTLVRSRNPIRLWKVLKSMIEENPGFAEHLNIRLTGKVDRDVRNAISDSGLSEFVTYIDYLPHSEVMAEQQSASVLLLILNNTPNAKGILTGKLFEYLAAGKPILCIGPPDGDAAEIIRETGSGHVCDFGSDTAIRQILNSYYSAFIEGRHAITPGKTDRYSRKSLTESLVSLLNEMER